MHSNVRLLCVQCLYYMFRFRFPLEIYFPFTVLCAKHHFDDSKLLADAIRFPVGQLGSNFEPTRQCHRLLHLHPTLQKWCPQSVGWLLQLLPMVDEGGRSSAVKQFNSNHFCRVKNNRISGRRMCWIGTSDKSAMTSIVEIGANNVLNKFNAYCRIWFWSKRIGPKNCIVIVNKRR